MLKMYLFAADRAWTYESRACPELARGSLVLWDRYVDSALAYRAAELRLGRSTIDMDLVIRINEPFVRPTAVILIDISTAVSHQRGLLNSLPEPYDLELLEQVRREYSALATQFGYDVVDGERAAEAVASDIAGIIRKRCPEAFV